MLKNDAISKAKQHLEANPIDAAHDLDHHQQVAQNCLAIINAHQLVVDPQLVEIAAWWHDVESQQGATSLLTSELKKTGLTTLEIEQIAQIVESHTFGAQPTTLEAKILYDADKMEYFNPHRLTKALVDAQNGSLPVETLKKHYLAWLERFQTVLDSFNFDYSRQFAHDNLVEAQEIIQKIRKFVATWQEAN